VEKNKCSKIYIVTTHNRQLHHNIQPIQPRLFQSEFSNTRKSVEQIKMSDQLWQTFLCLNWVNILFGLSVPRSNHRGKSIVKMAELIRGDPGDSLIKLQIYW